MNTRLMRLDKLNQRDGSIRLALDQRRGVTCFEYICAAIVGKEDLAGMEASRGGKRSPTGGTRIVREVWSIALMAGDGRMAHPVFPEGSPEKQPFLPCSKERGAFCLFNPRGLLDFFPPRKKPRAAAP